MNIFKVLASGRKSFQEETASAVLLWLINPNMDHGLGFSFLSKFFEKLSESGINNLKEETENFRTYFRGEDNSGSNIKFNLEYYVDNAFIDIVLFMDNWVIAIENKIYLKSFTKGQLQREYDGLLKDLKEQDDERKILMLYLVPNDGTIASDLKEEFKDLKVKYKKSEEDELKKIITWQRNKENYPSIAAIIDEILNDETIGNIDPIPTYTRDTLKALKVFISNNFEGYYYDNSSSSGGQNPMTEEELSIDDIRANSKYQWIGVKNGVSGLLRISKDKLEKYKTNQENEKHKFQCTSKDMSSKYSWIKRELFLDIVNWRLGIKTDAIEWPDLKLNSKLIYNISKDFPDIYVGIQGGINGLEKLEAEVIRDKSWQISMEEKNRQWISGSDFKSIIDKKQVF